MSFFVYMLKSMGNKPVTYVGYTNNLKKRINLHNIGKGAKFTRGRKWKLIYKEKHKSKKEVPIAKLLEEKVLYTLLIKRILDSNKDKVNYGKNIRG